MLGEDQRDNVPAFIHRIEHFLGGVDLEGKSVLEIGSGRGLLALYSALCGARRVVSLEPELEGASLDVFATQQGRIRELQLPVELLREDFNRWDPAGERFDVLISVSNINHLHESPHHALAHRDTYVNYLRIARRMHGMMAPGGVAIIEDSGRYGFFLQGRSLGIRRPWKLKRRSTNWRIHQTAATWRRIFLDSGFSRVDIDYPLPYSLRALRGIANSRIGAFFLQARFIIRCHE